MANPEDFNTVQSFKHVLKSRPSSFLPLMESNDVFIVSAIMAGLIKQVVWIKPNWKDDADDVVLANCYVGYTIMENTDERRVCVCQQGRNDSNSWEPFECYRISREGASINESMVTVTTDKCTKLRPYKFITMSENDVVKMLKLGNIKSAIFDIDEDYFGVQSGVGNFIAKGVSELIQTGLDYILGKMFCPQTIKAERTLNAKLKSFFNHFANVKAKKSIEKAYLEKELVKSAGEYMCRSPPKEEEIQYLFNLIFYLTVREMVALSKLNFCLYSKPRRTKAKESFGVCHGTIFPDHTLNQIYVGDTKDIRERGVRLNTVLTYLIKNAKLKFVTIARSLRDGYTPRDQQRFIEATVLASLKKAMQKYGKNPRVIYDQQLYGESGW